jgi:hypothetical protein
MAKVLIPSYTFTPSTDTIVIDGIYRLERFLLITNVTDNQIIFSFADSAKGISNYTINTTAETTTLVLTYDCSAMSASDKLQIFVEKDNQSFEPSETFVDPVSKLRISQPENLIDTDFEYGLQSTKWETLELVKNIPTFYSRTGDTSFSITSMSTINGSDLVTVELGEVHNFISGSPVIVSGSRSISCDGGFVVTNIISTTSFQYKSKSIQNFTGSILDTFTQIFAGSLYQGTEFDISGISAITTSGSGNTALTVTTAYPTNFTPGTSFFLTNSKGVVDLDIDASLVEANNFVTSTVTSTNNTATGETGSFALGAVQPYNYSGDSSKGSPVLYFRNSAVTIDAGAGVETITFPTAHGLSDNFPYVYVAGEGNTVIGGLTTFNWYYVRVVNPTTIYLTTTSGSTTRVNLSGAGTDGGVMRSAFIRGTRVSGVATATEIVTFVEPHNLTNSDNNVPLLFFGPGGAGNVSVSTDLLSSYTPYYVSVVSGATTMTIRTTPTGATLNMTTTTNGAVMIAASLLPDFDTIWFSNHGFETGDIATYTVQSGTAIGGITSSTAYRIEKVNVNRVRFTSVSNGAQINLTSFGSAAGQYRISGNYSILNNDSIFAPSNTLIDGSSVLYNNNGNSNISGLTSGDFYYVFQKSQNNFKLATTTAGFKTVERTFTQSSAVNVSTDVITTAVAHGFTNGDAVQYLSSTPISGLRSGAWYWARIGTTTTLTLHWTKAGANANTDRVDIGGPLSGSGSLRAADLVDIAASGTATHTFSATTPGAADGVYTLVDNITSNTFTVSTANVSVPLRIISINPNLFLDLSKSAFYSLTHGLRTGTAVEYNTTGTAIGGLTDSTTYYVIRVSKNWFRLASSEQNAIDGVSITLTSKGTGTDHTITTSTVSGEVLGPGTVTITAGETTITGTDTNFPSLFTRGNEFFVYESQTIGANVTVSSINTTTDVITTSASHGYITEDAVFVSSDSTPGGITEDGIYYVNVLSSTTLQLHPTPATATANTNKIDITSSGTSVILNEIIGIGATYNATIESINSTTEIIARESVANTTLTSSEYAVGTSLLLRADGFALHRPYDGGVELIPSTNPDSTMIRQTRKYFRYQSGKGIQVSFAVNFSPTTTIDSMVYDTGNTAIITTRFPSRVTEDLSITVSGATVTAGQNYWNGSFTVDSIIDPYSFRVNIGGQPADTFALGIPEYYVNTWSNSLLKCGLFDDQNGLYFEYDGSELYCCRRSSTLQISGTVSVQFKQGNVVGTNTKFLSQLNAGGRIVIKGQTYVISEIASNTLLYILPSYRGTDATNVIITKTIDTKIPQSQWNIDTCDGTGSTGFYLNTNKIQMAYMDYSWYGAGKVRFGFKDQKGKVVYVHEFIHNNKQNEAYMRSGNIPGRYEIENVGAPTYVPALAHWGTSVIMDGRYDNDRAYVFAASSNTLSISGTASIVANGAIANTSLYYVLSQGQFRTANYAIEVVTPSTALNAIPAGVSITGNGITGRLTANPLDTRTTPFQAYLPSVSSRIQFPGNVASTATRNLILLNGPPTATAAANNYTVTLSAATTSVVYEQPLISIRLAPSVDNGTPGNLGEREIINRMQLILDSVGILTTHSCEVLLKLNGKLNNYDWKRVANPSLSQLIYHDSSDRITEGTTVYTFRAQGTSGTTARSQNNIIVSLDEIATLGNSILGGDGTFPDGPDVLTLVVKLLEDPSNVTAANPFVVAGRIGWSESQA